MSKAKANARKTNAQASNCHSNASARSNARSK